MPGMRSVQLEFVKMIRMDQKKDLVQRFVLNKVFPFRVNSVNDNSAAAVHIAVIQQHTGVVCQYHVVLHPSIFLY